MRSDCGRSRRRTSRSRCDANVARPLISTFSAYEHPSGCQDIRFYKINECLKLRGGEERPDVHLWSFDTQPSWEHTPRCLRSRVAILPLHVVDSKSGSASRFERSSVLSADCPRVRSDPHELLPSRASRNIRCVRRVPRRRLRRSAEAMDRYRSSSGPERRAQTIGLG
jgi:hypothetical protein